MGGGSWTEKEYSHYSKSVGRDVDSTGRIDISDKDVRQIYKVRRLSKELDPLNIMRECCDSEEHPNTLPVIIGIDVTGSMGSAAMEVAASINNILTELYKEVADVEFAIMGIGDSYYDTAPCQISQFESDVRIAQWLDEIYFEAGGGPNAFESYSYAWYMGAKHTKLDCWKRGKKGIIITIGDEILNPYIEGESIRNDIGDDCQTETLSTADIYAMVKDKYNLYHIHIEHGYSSSERAERVKDSFSTFLPAQNIYTSKVENLSKVITGIIKNDVTDTPIVTANENENWQNDNGEITW